MSTKIYDGLVIETSNIFDFTDRLHTAVTEVYNTLAKKLVMAEVSQYLHGTDENYDPQLSLITNVRKAWKADTVLADLRFQLVIGQAFTGKILAHPFCSEKRYLETLHAFPEVSDYGYWDNTDPEEEVTENDWDLRRQEWDSVLSEESSFSNLLHYTLDSENPFKHLSCAFFSGDPIDDWLDVQPTPENRLRAAVRKMVFASLEFADAKDFQTIMKLVSLIDAMPVDALGSLPPKITRELLVSKDVLPYPFDLNTKSIISYLQKQM